MSRKLFFQKSANLENTNYCVETLLPDIPFYGMKGTICRIEVLKDVDDNRELFYYKVLYNYDGSINSDKIRISKKYLSSVVDDYYNDLKKYLDLNSDKYLDYKKNRLVNKLDDKIIKLSLAISSGLVMIGIPILMSTVYVGAIIEAIFILSLYTTYNMRKKNVEEDEKIEFIRQYDNYQKNLVEHNIVNSNKNNKISKTIYTYVSKKEQSLENELPKVKSKILIKEGTVEAI